MYHPAFIYADMWFIIHVCEEGDTCLIYKKNIMCGGEGAVTIVLSGRAHLLFKNKTFQ